MDSESVVSSTFSNTTTTTTTKSQAKRTVSAVWAHALPLGEGNKSRERFCKHCPPECRYSTSVTTNFRSHLRAKHDVIVEENPPSQHEVDIQRQFQELYERARRLDRRADIDKEVFEGQLDPTIISEALVSLVVLGNLSFRLVESPAFHTFCRALNPEALKCIPSSHSTVSSLIEKSWQSHKDIVRKILQSAISSIHLSLDIWTSPNQHLFLGVCSHFVDREEVRRKALIGLREVSGHAGKEQFAVLLPVLQDYGITRKIGCVMGDSATTNDTLCRTMSEYLQDKEGLTWDPDHCRLRCLGHIINLAVQGFLFHGVLEIDKLESREEETEEGETEEEKVKARGRRAKFRRLGPLGKLHNVVVYIRSSSQKIAEFRALVGRLIPLDNKTRWNSWYEMVEVAVIPAIASAVDAFTKNHLQDLKEDYLALKDWENLRAIKQFLFPFYRATMEAQGDKATLDRVLWVMDVLIQWFEKSLAKYSSNPEFSARIKKGWEIFDKYYSKSDQSPYYVAALILHPSRRVKYITTVWKKVWHKAALRQVKDLWHVYRDRPLPTPSYDPVEELEKSGKEEELDDFERTGKELWNFRPTSQDEYDEYANGEPCDIGDLSVLQWWCQQRKKWPRLSLMAIDILSIPAMSDEPERVFSGARRTIRWDRSQLGPEMIEKVECLKHWKRTELTYGVI